MTIKLALAALVLGVTGLGAVYSWMARPQNSTGVFICPETQPRTTRMAIEETAADVARASAALSGPEQENAIRVIVAELKRRHPEAGTAEIVNYLMTAYCPLVQVENGLSDREKRERMDRFSSQIYSIVR
jgi:hypothetical protein